jgi:DNA-binding MarR family transcriptional regulator
MASVLGVARSTVTRLVDQLVAKGLLARVQSPNDGRALNLEMTTEAEAAWETALAVAEDVSMSAFDGIRARDLERLFDRLESNLES